MMTVLAPGAPWPYSLTNKTPAPTIIKTEAPPKPSITPLVVAHLRKTKMSCASRMKKEGVSRNLGVLRKTLRELLAADLIVPVENADAHHSAKYYQLKGMQ